MPRRAFLRASLTGLSALGLADLLKLQAKAGVGGPSGRGPSMIVLWLWGGPSHMETFDLKPDAPSEYRGTFRPIETVVPGLEISEKLPRLAQVADRFSLIRSVSHDSPGHMNSTHTVLTGYTGEIVETPPYEPTHPDIFNAAHALLPSLRPDLPQWVALPNQRYEGGAYLGRSHGPFRVGADPSAPDFRVPELILDAARREQLSGRSRLLAAFDRVRADLDTQGETFDHYRQQALQLLSGTAARDAFDLEARTPG